MRIQLLSPLFVPDEEDLCFVMGADDCSTYIVSVPFMSIFVVYVEYRGEYYKVAVDDATSYPTMLEAVGAASIVFAKLLNGGLPEEEAEAEYEDNAFTRFIQSDLNMEGI